MASPFKPIKPIRYIQRRAGGERFSPFGELPRTLRPTEAKGLDLKGIEVDGRITFSRKGPHRGEREALERRAVSIESVYGSIWERIIYKSLLQRRLLPGRDFTFQTRLIGGPGPNGGRAELGGLVADFVIPEKQLVINPLGYQWHAGHLQRIRDAVQEDLLKGLGFRVWAPWDYEIEPEPLYNELLRQHLDAPSFRQVSVNGLGAVGRPLRGRR